MNLLNELLNLNELKNHLGETEYNTYSGWKTACRKVDDKVWFDGDKDICNAMVGEQPYKRGKTRAIGEWDGSVGSVHSTGKKIMKEGNEARVEQLQNQLEQLNKQMEPLKKRAAALQKQLSTLGVTEALEVEDMLCEAIDELYEKITAQVSTPTKKLTLSRVHAVMLSPSDPAFKGILKDKVFGIRNEDPIIAFLIDILGVPLDGTPYKIRTGFMKYESKQKMLFIARFKSDLPGEQKVTEEVIEEGVQSDKALAKIMLGLEKLNVKTTPNAVSALFVGGSDAKMPALLNKIVKLGYDDGATEYKENLEFWKKLAVTKADFDALVKASL